MAMVRPVSPLGGGSISPMRQQSSIVAASGGSIMGSIWRAGIVMGSVTLGSRATTAPKLIKGWTNFTTSGREIEILNVYLSRVQARPGACDTTTVCLGLFTAHNLHAVREETLGCSRYLAELLEKRMR